MIPAVPGDATIRSLLAAYRSSGAFYTLAEPFAATTPVIAGNPFGMHARSLQERIFGSQITVQALLRKHSQAGLWGGFFNEATETKWFAALAAGNRHSSQRSVHAVIVANARVRYGRKCPLCLKDDLCKFGFGHWHVLHQIPIVRHCHIHGCKLVTLCPRCDAASASLHPAHITCQACSDVSQMEIPTTVYESSLGYEDTLALLADLYTGRLPPFRPRVRGQLFTAAFWENTSRRHVDLLPEFLSTWNFSSYDEFSHTFRTTSSASVQALLQGFPVPIPLNVTAAVTAFALRNAGKAWAPVALAVDYTSEDLFQARQHLSVALSHQSIDCLQDEGFPPGSLSLLLSGEPRGSLTEKFGITSTHLIEVENKLPHEMRGLLKKQRDSYVRAGNQADIDNRRQPHRAIALQCKANGVTTRYKLRSVAPDTHSFLQTHDWNWLRVEFPTPPDWRDSSGQQGRDAPKT